MAKLTLYFCDLCDDSSKKDFVHRIRLWDKTEDNDTVGDICPKCYKALLGKLKQETEPVLPRAEDTPSEKVKSPINVRDLIPITREEIKEVVDKVIEYDGPPTDELLDCEISYQPSTFTLEKKREYLKTLRDQGCQHKRGVSMDEDGSGLTCIECREKVKV